MNVLDGTTRVNPDMNEEAQRWIETSKGRKKTRPPSSDVPPLLHTNTERTTSASPAGVKSPPSSQIASQSALQHADRNTFEESFAAALTKPRMAYNGQFDGVDEYDDQTPLLNSYYKGSHATQHAAPHAPRHAPIEPPSKSKPSRGICLWNEVSHNSQYTRTAVEILREVLDVRYPVASAPAGYEPLPGDQESQGLLSGNKRCAKRRWWRKLLRARRAHD
ncbi:hypothetical protein MBLNU13_g04252t1 [Cladosporium sp. NU13]